MAVTAGIVGDARLRLQRELGIGDGGELCAGLGALAFLRFERDDRAAEPRAGDELADRLDYRLAGGAASALLETLHGIYCAPSAGGKSRRR
jgi:hypothetical protein